jgi:hypothetical protein
LAEAIVNAWLGDWVHFRRKAPFSTRPAKGFYYQTKQKLDAENAEFFADLYNNSTMQGISLRVLRVLRVPKLLCPVENIEIRDLKKNNHPKV